VHHPFGFNMRWLCHVPSKRRLRFSILAAALVLAIIPVQYSRRLWAVRVFAGGSVPDVPVATVSAGGVRNILRVGGAIEAIKSVMLQAPRIRGSRSGLNRGGDSSSTRGGGDFNLVLLALAKPGARVKTGEMVAQFDPESQKERLDDYRDAVIQKQANIQ